MRENTDQKHSEYRHFLRSASQEHFLQAIQQCQAKYSSVDRSKSYVTIWFNPVSRNQRIINHAAFRKFPQLFQMPLLNLGYDFFSFNKEKQAKAMTQQLQSAMNKTMTQNIFLLGMCPKENVRLRMGRGRKVYSEISLQQTLLGRQNSVRYREVSAIQRFFPKLAYFTSQGCTRALGCSQIDPKAHKPAGVGIRKSLKAIY